ncbi:MAG TPA: NADH-quinone oxidoreductase subunit NuoH, partial [Smithellaceae bacterium]|nr:NADH-quinone oxidoreductase subunit NuoH [Smithellaceae bacterium]
MKAKVELTILKIIIIFAAIMSAIAYTTLLERRFLGFFQIRLGPNRVGPFGLFQPIADGIKLLFKDDMTVNHAEKVYFIAAPMIAVAATLLCFAVIPFSGGILVADLSVAVLYLMAISSVGVYGVLLAGWSSNNKYSALGGYRAAAQMLSYELPLALALVGVITLSGSFSLVDIVNAQQGLWYIVKQPLGFMIFIICLFAETNRTPFDFYECDNELVAGYQTEYSSMKFGLFYLAEYAHILLASCLVTVFYLGGWHGPLLPPLIWFLLKVFFMLFVFIWVRATYPRFRYDNLMNLSWKILLPLAFFNILIT